MAPTENAIADRDAVFRHLEERISIRSLLVHTLFPAVLRTTVPRPPVFIVTLAVECAFSSDRDVLLFEGVDERRIVKELDPFPAREDYRQVVVGVMAELDCCAFGDLEIHVALQVNCAGEIRAGRHDHLTAARFGALIYGIAKGGSAIRAAVSFRA